MLFSIECQAQAIWSWGRNRRIRRCFLHRSWNCLRTRRAKSIWTNFQPTVTLTSNLFSNSLSVSVITILHVIWLKIFVWILVSRTIVLNRNSLFLIERLSKRSNLCFLKIRCIVVGIRNWVKISCILLILKTIRHRLINLLLFLLCYLSIIRDSKNWNKTKLSISKVKIVG